MSLDLPQTGVDGRARLAALDRATREAEPTAILEYKSAGALLIVGESLKQAEPVAASLRGKLNCTVVITGEPPGQDRDDAVVFLLIDKLTGHLGNFVATVMTPNGERTVSEVTGRGKAPFDMVLDLGGRPLIDAEVRPPGYYAPGGDAHALNAALEELPEMVGEFEKPKYFNYDPAICAHGNSGVEGCTRCLDACPTDAIKSLKEMIEVDPYLCQGGGSCATACPTGAISYAYPTVSDLLENVRLALKAYRDAGGERACALFYDREAGAEQVARISAAIPETVIPFQIEELGSLGMDAWFAALAYGASHVALLAVEKTPRSVLTEIEAQLEFAHAVLEGLGHAPARLALLSGLADEQIVTALGELAPQPDLPPDAFMAVNEKRTNLRLALDFLYHNAPAPADSAPLPQGAPFGEIQVNKEACTLCMGCVSVCPSSALMDGKDKPQLRFIEWNCVQCGLCEKACPETAITRNPRVLYKPELRNETRILNEEAPFCCVVCGKPFATNAMMERITSKLKDHWMYQNEDALKRLKMCEDCRVKDMYASEMGIDIYNKH
ncbi:MAG: 4Fe-4S binding protein [Gammaproteobacteria bacterium]